MITVTVSGRPNAVLSGLFFDPASSTQSVTTASLLGRDTATQDNSIGALRQFGDQRDWHGGFQQQRQPSATAGGLHLRRLRRGRQFTAATPMNLCAT